MSAISAVMVAAVLGASVVCVRVPSLGCASVLFLCRCGAGALRKKLRNWW